ncbi:uncharacterized protein LOC122001591 [Zingiber officinale]|uniref:uncharacterized protein LOC122001591 n=1 Tax=Zingiber officinale TaxID=94328 RepID=UPI001C4C9C7A|nr:uncharacterized protein LOC122001591 [Zingiber officinale]
MTQKGNLFKGLQKRRTIPPNRHGKTSQTRKVNLASPWSREEVLEAVQDIQGDGSGPKLSKFINHCNEIKAATAASKEGGQLSILKLETNASAPSKTQEEKLEHCCQN